MTELYWNDIPVGAENAVSYAELCAKWGKNKRAVRRILHDLSKFDNGDNYVLIRSGHKKGFYKTDNAEVMQTYRREVLSKGKSIFAPIGKINRILNQSNTATQGSFFNNLKAVRMERGLSQAEVCRQMKAFDASFDAPTLSKMENGAVFPTPYQLLKLAEIYGCKPSELVTVDLYALNDLTVV